MIKFLIHRPIAILMAYLALVIVGVIAFLSLPMTLLPDIAIPDITVKITEPTFSARELESSVVTPFRRQLMQINGLNEIKSETRDGSSIIKLKLAYGVNTDLAYIEANEKIDAAMNSLPKAISRPKTIKGSATDIPVTYLHVTSANDDDNFIDICELSEEIVRHRLEQLPEVAMVDITGVPGKQLKITPNQAALKSAGLTIDEIESTLIANNMEQGSMTVRDGYYEYNIQVSNLLRSAEDINNIAIEKDGRIFKIEDLCDVRLIEIEPRGYSYHNGKRAVTMAIIKEASASMDALEKAVDASITYFQKRYPGIEISKSRSQTKLLDYTIKNLEQNLIIGLLIVFLLCAVFMRNNRLPVIIGSTVLVAVLMTFILFYLFNISINILSMAGLILAAGMMIDNSVIVAENISQYQQRGYNLEQSCILGTNEMITPMLSSSLTTVAVFLPLVFMSGIAGAIFSDQAFSITAGLTSSFVVGITLLPVLYSILMRGTQIQSSQSSADDKTSELEDNKRKTLVVYLYNRGMDWIIAHKGITLSVTLMAIFGFLVIFPKLQMERMPKIGSTETIVNIDWNENINLEENRRRTDYIIKELGPQLEENSAFIGMQDFLIGATEEKSVSETELYLRVSDTAELEPLKAEIAKSINREYPDAIIDYSQPENIFDKIFSSDEKPLEAYVSVKNVTNTENILKIDKIASGLEKELEMPIERPPLRSNSEIIIDKNKLILYNVSSSEVLKTLRSTFKGDEIGTLRTNHNYIPIHIKSDNDNLADLLEEKMIPTLPDENGKVSYIPLQSLITITKERDFKKITAFKGGEYTVFGFDADRSEANIIKEVVSAVSSKVRDVDVSFGGSIFSNKEMMWELMIILILSVLLMYFILCAQFESFVQPFIVLIEIPIDITFAFLALWAFGQTLNVMSAIGIILTCGIVVNDSILKIDAINELRKKGIPLLKAVHVAGERRLKPILMTSATTILAMIPVLFTFDLGSELQKPLAIAVIGSMVVGTFVSIFIIPLFYFLIYQRRPCDVS